MGVDEVGEDDGDRTRLSCSAVDVGWSGVEPSVV